MDLQQEGQQKQKMVWAFQQKMSPHVLCYSFSGFNDLPDLSTLEGFHQTAENKNTAARLPLVPTCEQNH